MECATIISSSEQIIEFFEQFIFLSYPTLDYKDRDVDTFFFVDPKTKRNKLYYHYQPADFKKEFSYNYDEESIRSINLYFGNKELYGFDFQYSGEEIIKDLLSRFIDFLVIKDPKLISKIIVSHPFDGVLPLNEFG